MAHWSHARYRWSAGETPAQEEFVGGGVVAAWSERLRAGQNALCVGEFMP